MSQVSRSARCPRCGCSLQVPDSLTGGQVRCSQCANVFAIDAVTSPGVCPSCRAVLPAGASGCLECGYQSSASINIDEAAANLCPNAVCGVANPAGTRMCQRCNTPLPAVLGQVLADRYRIDKQIAAGGFGIVYAGTDLQLQRPVAVKEMIAADPQEFAQRKVFFHREAAVLEHLQSSAIVPRLFAYIDGKDHAFLVMEFIQGRNLLDVLEKPGQGPFPVGVVARWGCLICEVLEIMHARQPAVVHRDLKPDNIMLLPDGQTIRLIDFGTARALARSGKDRTVSRTKVFTEGYAAPEQVIGKAEPRSDLFALAGTLYHLATGQAPEGTFTGREIGARLRSGNPGWPESDIWFYELLAVNLSESPADRYLCARDVRVDLEKRSLTREMVCPKCARPNQAREPYCKFCAAALTAAGDSCPKCARTNRMGCRFCIACGSRMHA